MMYIIYIEQTKDHDLKITIVIVFVSILNICIFEKIIFSNN